MDFNKIQAKLFNTQVLKDGQIATVTRNNQNIYVVFKEIDDKAPCDTKYIFTTANLNQGDMFYCNGSYYIITQKTEPFNVVYNRYVIIKSNVEFKIIIDKNINTFRAFTDVVKLLDISQNNYIASPTGKISLLLSSTENTKKIKLNDRIIKWGRAWKVTGIDNTKEGLISLTMDLTEINTTNDDILGEVADRWLYESKFTYNIVTDPITASINPTSTFTINTVVYKDGVAMNNPTLTYVSSNNVVATVDTNGVVTGISLGLCNIIVSFIDEVNNKHEAIINLTIVEKPKTYTIVTEPINLSLNEGQTQQLTTIVKEDGVTIGNPSLIYTSNNELIATVNNTGLITCIKEGTTTIIVSYTDPKGVIHDASCNVTVTKPVIPDNFTYSFTYGTTVTFAVRKYQTGQFIPHKFNNGVEIPTLWNFAVSYTSPASSTATPTMEITDSYIKIKNSSVTSGSLVITATERNATNTVQQTITFTA